MTTEYKEQAMDVLVKGRHRKVLEMRFAGLTYREIAEQTGMSIANAVFVFDKYSKRLDEFVRVKKLAEEKGSALDVPIYELKHMSPKHGSRVHRATDVYLLRGSTLRQVCEIDPKHMLKLSGIGPKSAFEFMQDMRRSFRGDRSLVKMTLYFQSRMSKHVKSPIPHKVLDAIKVIREHGYSVSVKSKYDRKEEEAEQCQ